MEKGLLCKYFFCSRGFHARSPSPQWVPCRLQRRPPGSPAARALLSLPSQHNRAPRVLLLLLALSLPVRCSLSLSGCARKNPSYAAAQDLRFRPHRHSPRPLVCCSGSATTTSSSTREESTEDGLGRPCRAFSSSAPAGFTDESPPFPASPSSPVGSHASRVSMRCSAPPFPSP